MADLTPVIETMEHSFMRAWVNQDMRALKAVTARDFVLLVGSKPPALLDYRSFVDAAADRWSCSSYRFGTIYVRSYGAMALFATQVEFKGRLDGREWSGTLWFTDLWRKGRVRRRWRMVERVISAPDARPDIAASIQSLQLWR
jgi:hypothetical protein